MQPWRWRCWAQGPAIYSDTVQFWAERAEKPDIWACQTLLNSQRNKSSHICQFWEKKKATYTIARGFLNQRLQSWHLRFWAENPPAIRRNEPVLSRKQRNQTHKTLAAFFEQPEKNRHALCQWVFWIERRAGQKSVHERILLWFWRPRETRHPTGHSSFGGVHRFWAERRESRHRTSLRSLSRSQSRTDIPSSPHCFESREKQSKKTGLRNGVLSFRRARGTRNEPPHLVLRGQKRHTSHQLICSRVWSPEKKKHLGLWMYLGSYWQKDRIQRKEHEFPSMLLWRLRNRQHEAQIPAFKQRIKWGLFFRGNLGKESWVSGEVYEDVCRGGCHVHAPCLPRLWRACPFALCDVAPHRGSLSNWETFHAISLICFDSKHPSHPHTSISNTTWRYNLALQPL